MYKKKRNVGLNILASTSIILIILLFCLLINIDIPIITKVKYYSIGIYAGTNPISLSNTNKLNRPALSAKDIKDIPAEFIADPFMIHKDSCWYMFFEVMNKKTKQGDIGLAISNDLIKWSYEQIVLDEPFHLSYPYVFEFNNEFYMIPESYKANSIRLYKATNFPTKWKFQNILIGGSEFVDTSIIYFNEKWWLFTFSVKIKALRIFYAAELFGSWQEHKMSPILGGGSISERPGGRIININNKIIRFVQDDIDKYGKCVYAFEIVELDTRIYKERKIGENAVLGPSGIGWNRNGMHHIDPHFIRNYYWVACVDGFKTSIAFKFK